LQSVQLSSIYEISFPLKLKYWGIAKTKLSALRVETIPPNFVKGLRHR
jgi:hypothetical protein